jgi:hypothetical protein
MMEPHLARSDRMPEAALCPDPYLYDRHATLVLPGQASWNRVFASKSRFGDINSRQIAQNAQLIAPAC